MTRPVTLFTGQWADLSLPDLAEKASQMGYDGLELACWGDHFGVDKAAISEEILQGTLKFLLTMDLLHFHFQSFGWTGSL